MGGLWDLDLRPDPQLPQSFCGMEGVEEQLEMEKRERAGEYSSGSLQNASVPELLRELARKLEGRGSNSVDDSTS